MVEFQKLADFTSIILSPHLPPHIRQKKSSEIGIVTFLKYNLGTYISNIYGQNSWWLKAVNFRGKKKKTFDVFSKKTW